MFDFNVEASLLPLVWSSGPLLLPLYMFFVHKKILTYKNNTSIIIVYLAGPMVWSYILGDGLFELGERIRKT